FAMMRDFAQNGQLSGHTVQARYSGSNEHNQTTPRLPVIPSPESFRGREWRGRGSRDMDGKTGVSEWEVSESNLWNNSRDVSTLLDITNPVAAALWAARLAQAIHISAALRTSKRL